MLFLLGLLTFFLLFLFRLIYLDKYQSFNCEIIINQILQDTEISYSK